MDSGDSVPAMIIGVIEGVTSDTFGSFPCDEFDGLHDAGNDLNDA